MHGDLICWRLRRDSYRLFPRSPLGRPGTMITRLAHTHEKKNKEQKHLHVLESRC